ncbi:hypothetical protein COY26_05425 [Candidatus Woesearchaeota archaeon CG_4_10_14_0_2_um_filter_33_10]|nr:MAG: hypothetical protein AUJ83_02100 [Candidatus Woesearchaeota archaeon CG1_02_33_12]PIN78692.1 MAG: hypothetical protein COV14_02645 [Candidatus Woesearchaeota archaeon CG10_big_fil_rev_8_21_14_0_10_33_12]PIU72173.1 MAG: hypothetical protein COS79_04335 [Candidatus Woesearchaeota archaeon CG06_land_8_20_14_3_00_33_13]PIZ51842.1 MAG: hypothetical protein COY26_05425 [Candidatus Woesearchaeota archaeon CG_4_10_14_0_2_um_filter_33_10]
MGLKKTIGILVLTGAVALTSYFSVGCTRTKTTKPVVQERVIGLTEKQEQLMYGIAGKNIDGLLAYTEGIVSEKPEEFKNYILDISKIGIDNNYDKEIVDMFSDELLEKRISEMPNERKLSIIKPLIDKKVGNTYNKIVDFAEKQKPKVKELYKKLENRINSYLNEGEQ